MIWPERVLQDRKCPLIKRLGLRILMLRAVKNRQVIEGRRYIRMIDLRTFPLIFQVLFANSRDPVSADSLLAKSFATR